MSRRIEGAAMINGESPHRIRRFVGAAAVVVTLAVVGACGGGSNSATNTTEPGTTEPGTTEPGRTVPETTEPDFDRAVILGLDAPPDATAPTATLPADLGDPEIVAEAAAPMNVIGEALPYFEGGYGKPDAAIGQPAPVILGYDLEGQAYRIDPAEQGNTMIVIAAHWCPHCAVEVPLLVDMYNAGEIPDDLNVYAVMASPNPSAPNWPPTAWMEGLGWPYPVLLDGLAEVEHDGTTQLRGVINPAMGSDGFPTVVLIDSDGNLAARFSGEVPREQILETLDAAF